MDLLKRSWLTYLLELVIAIIFMSFGLEVFLIYAFLAIMFGIDRKIDYLRKLIRVFSISNEAKIAAIIKKLEVSEKELTEIGEELKDNMTEKQYEEFNREIRDVQGF